VAEFAPPPGSSALASTPPASPPAPVAESAPTVAALPAPPAPAAIPSAPAAPPVYGYGPGFWPPTVPDMPTAADFYARQQQAMEEARKRWEQQMQNAPVYPPRGRYPYYWPPEPPRYPVR